MKLKKIPRKQLEKELDLMTKMTVDLQWMARRYADGRSTYVTSWFNQITQYLNKKHLYLNPCDGIIWARDGMGRHYDHLTEAQATTGTMAALGGDLNDQKTKEKL